jgi:hypothetical protein
MQRVNVNQFYIFGHTLHPIAEIKPLQKISDVYGVLFGAEMWLDFILQDRITPIGVSAPAGYALLASIRAILYPLPQPQPPTVPASTSDEAADAAQTPNLEREITVFEAYDLATKLQTFEIVLAAELQAQNTYFVSRKLGYETAILIEEAHRLLPETILDAISDQTVAELQQAGRCIALEIPTAAGFHIVRATEAVLREYYAEFVGASPKPKMRNWGSYIRNLRKTPADAKTLGYLDHIRESYRNPVFHPEEMLSPEKAQVLLGVCISAIVLMVTEMMEKRARATALAPVP